MTEQEHARYERRPVVSADALCSKVSQSKLLVWSWCQAKFFYQYVQGLWGPPSPQMALGTAFDETVNDGYREKRDHERDPRIKDSQERFAAHFERSVEEVEDFEDESRGSLKDDGVRHVGKWASEVAPDVIPHDVQKRFSLDIAGCEINGVIDVSMELRNQKALASIQRGLFVVDHKITKRSWTETQAAKQLQNVFYSYAGRTGQLADGVNPDKIGYEVMVRNKKPKRQSFVVAVTDRDRLFTANLIETARRGWRAAYTSGAFYPNRGHFMCSRRQCQHWRKCEQEHGGQVDP